MVKSNVSSFASNPGKFFSLAGLSRGSRTFTKHLHGGNIKKFIHGNILLFAPVAPSPTSLEHGVNNKSAAIAYILKVLSNGSFLSRPLNYSAVSDSVGYTDEVLSLTKQAHSLNSPSHFSSSTSRVILPWDTFSSGTGPSEVLIKQIQESGRGFNKTLQQA
jgi:hypothetical protein